MTGRFRTAPGRSDDVRFLWSGDIAGQGWGVNPDLGGFRIAHAMRSRRADFFLCSGDNVYADGPVVESVPLPDGSTWRNLTTPAKSKVAETLDEFRGQYQYNLLADNLRAVPRRGRHGLQWDDHEVTNNWYPGEILDDAAVHREAGRRARRPRPPGLLTSTSPSPRSARPGGRDLSRHPRTGPLLDLFVLDMRTHKDPNTANRESRIDGGVLGETQIAVAPARAVAARGRPGR